MTDSTMNSNMNNFINYISVYIKNNLSNKVNITVIKNTNGNKKTTPTYCQSGSFIYYIYDKFNNIIYIGETGTSIKNRLFNHGSGAHKSKYWFKHASYIRYFKDNNMTVDERKLIERALILKYRQIYKLYNK